jgi:hypothetical protein
MLTMAGTAIKMDMLWKLTPCGSSTDTGIRLMIQQILNRDDIVFFSFSRFHFWVIFCQLSVIKFSYREVDLNHKSSTGPFVSVCDKTKKLFADQIIQQDTHKKCNTCFGKRIIII